MRDWRPFSIDASLLLNAWWRPAASWSMWKRNHNVEFATESRVKSRVLTGRQIRNTEFLYGVQEIAACRRKRPTARPEKPEGRRNRCHHFPGQTQVGAGRRLTSPIATLPDLVPIIPSHITLFALPFHRLSPRLSLLPYIEIRFLPGARGTCIPRRVIPSHRRRESILTRYITTGFPPN